MKHSLFLDGWIEIGSILDKVWIGAVLGGRVFRLFLKVEIVSKGSIYKRTSCCPKCTNDGAMIISDFSWSLF